MSKLILFVPALLAASCAAHRSEPAAPVSAQPIAPSLTVAAQIAPTAAEPATNEAIEVKTVDVEELDNGLVCEARQRSASRISRRVCYTREEYALVQEQQREQAQRYARDLSRDQELREQQQRMEQERRRPVGAQ